MEKAPGSYLSGGLLARYLAVFGEIPGLSRLISAVLMALQASQQHSLLLNP